jgi:hypothetical protein
MSRRAWWVLATLLLIAPAAEAADPDLGTLLKDLMVIKHVESRWTLSIWLPPESLRVMMAASGQMTPAGIDHFMKDVERYQVVAVAVRDDEDSGKSDSPPADVSMKADVIRKTVTIEDQKGNQIRPLDDSVLPPFMVGFLGAMRPSFEKAGGFSGMVILAFPAKTTDGRQVAVATQDGALVVHVGSTMLRYRTPLGSLLPPVVDPKTGESFPGSFHFNPYTGDKLQSAPQQP